VRVCKERRSPVTGHQSRVTDVNVLTDFFLRLKSSGVPVSVKEYLMLVEALAKGVADYRCSGLAFHHSDLTFSLRLYPLTALLTVE
jgi:hypothetical protein